MSEAAPPSTLAPASSEALPEPLRLPRGSVRGGLAVLLTGTYGYLLLQGRAVPTVLVNTVIVVLAFYFGTHAAPSAPKPWPGQPGMRHAWIVRGLILLGFLGLASWFLWQDLSLSALPPALMEVLEVLGGYVLGFSLSWLVHRRAKETPLRRRIATVFRDLSAAGALAFAAFACYAFVNGLLGAWTDRAEQALSLVITYYFGSRVLSH